MPHSDDLSGFAAQRQAHDARDILAKIVYRFLARFMHGHRRQFSVRDDRRAILRGNAGRDAQIFDRGAPPFRIGEISRGVVRFAVVKIGHAHRAVLCDLPGRVRADHIDRTVRIGDANLQQQSLAVCGVTVSACE